MSWLRDWWQIRREQKLIKAMIYLAIEEQRRQRGIADAGEEILFESRPEGCYGDDCNNCRCDLAPL